MLVDVGGVDRQRRGDDALAAVVEAHRGLDAVLGVAAVQGGEQRRVLGHHVAAAQLLGARHLLVIGVEFLVQDDEAPDLRAPELGRGSQRAVDLGDVLADQPGDRRERDQFAVAAEGVLLAVGPVAQRVVVDVDDADHAVVPVAGDDGLADVLREAQPVLDLARRELHAGDAQQVGAAVDDAHFAGGVDDRGVAGAEPAGGVGDAERQPGAADAEFALLDAHFHAVDRPPDDVGGAAPVARHTDHARALGAAVDSLEVDAQRTEVAEQLAADGLAGDVQDANARHPERVLERRVDQPAAERILQALAQADRLADQDALAGVRGDGEEVAVEAPLERRGVLHPQRDLLEQRLERARRRDVEGRADVAQVGGHGVGRFRAVDRVAADLPLRKAAQVLLDPGQGQPGQDLVALAEPFEACNRRRGVDQRGVGQAHDLGLAGRAGGVQHDGHIRRRAAGDLGVDLGDARAAALDEALERQQPGVGVGVEPARAGVDDVRQARHLRAQQQQLVDLLLVLGDRVRDAQPRHQRRDLVGRGVFVERHGQRADGLRTEHREVQPRPVAAQDRHRHAAPDAQREPAGGDLARLRGDLAPGPGLPDAEGFLAQRRPLTPRGGVVQQELRQRLHVHPPSYRCAWGPTLRLQQALSTSGRH